MRISGVVDLQATRIIEESRKIQAGFGGNFFEAILELRRGESFYRLSISEYLEKTISKSEELKKLIEAVAHKIEQFKKFIEETQGRAAEVSLENAYKEYLAKLYNQVNDAIREKGAESVAEKTGIKEIFSDDKKSLVENLNETRERVAKYKAELESFINRLRGDQADIGPVFSSSIDGNKLAANLAASIRGGLISEGAQAIDTQSELSGETAWQLLAN